MSSRSRSDNEKIAHMPFIVVVVDVAIIHIDIPRIGGNCSHCLCLNSRTTGSGLPNFIKRLLTHSRLDRYDSGFSLMQTFSRLYTACLSRQSVPAPGRTYHSESARSLDIVSDRGEDYRSTLRNPGDKRYADFCHCLRTGRAHSTRRPYPAADCPDRTYVPWKSYAWPRL